MQTRRSVLIVLMSLALAGGWWVKSIARESTASSEITLIDHTKIGAALAKPSFNTLFQGKSGDGSFVVMTASRDRAGEVEVHNLDTDVFYMLSGTATLVTGGTVVEGKTTQPNEIRGKSIQGGESHHLAKGDVVIIPHGVPHWVKEVQGPLHYFVVKVH